MKTVIKKEMVLKKPYKENVSLTNMENSEEFTLNSGLYLTMLLLTLPIITVLLLIWFEIK